MISKQHFTETFNREPPVFPPTPATWAEVVANFDEIPVSDLIWFMLHDSIHHRGQLSVYMRAADEKVPSIYGPSAAEPWM